MDRVFHKTGLALTVLLVTRPFHLLVLVLMLVSPRVSRSYKVDGVPGDGEGEEFAIDENDAQRLQRTYSIREEVVRYGTTYTSTRRYYTHCRTHLPTLHCSLLAALSNLRTCQNGGLA